MGHKNSPVLFQVDDISVFYLSQFIDAYLGKFETVSKDFFWLVAS